MTDERPATGSLRPRHRSQPGDAAPVAGAVGRRGRGSEPVAVDQRSRRDRSSRRHRGRRDADVHSEQLRRRVERSRDGAGSRLRTGRGQRPLEELPAGFASLPAVSPGERVGRRRAGRPRGRRRREPGGRPCCGRPRREPQRAGRRAIPARAHRSVTTTRWVSCGPWTPSSSSPMSAVELGPVART